MLLLVLGLLTVVAATSRILKGQLLPPSVSSGSSSSRSTTPLSVHTCVSTENIFADDKRPLQTTERFRSMVRAVVQERQDLIAQSPDSARCTVEDDNLNMPMPMLQALASRLPGWNDAYFDTWTNKRETLPKPVTFASFSSVLFELQREYECKLSQYEIDSPSVVVSGSGAEQNGVAPLDYSLFPHDLNINRRISSQQEKVQSRQALLRTINALRSFELAMPVTAKLDCLQRRYMDLRNEMTLLADAVSCLPRIWDAATSLHDRAKDSPLTPSSSSSSAPPTP